MAEFQEVVRQYNRMCKTIGRNCLGCRIDPERRSSGGCPDFLTDKPARAEELVMGWAADHPEKTLKDVLLEHFPNAPMGVSGEPDACPETLGMASCPKAEDEACSCLECWNRPAPEE